MLSLGREWYKLVPDPAVMTISGLRDRLVGLQIQLDHANFGEANDEGAANFYKFLGATLEGCGEVKKIRQ